MKPSVVHFAATAAAPYVLLSDGTVWCLEYGLNEEPPYNVVGRWRELKAVNERPFHSAQEA